MLNDVYLFLCGIKYIDVDSRYKLCPCTHKYIMFCIIIIIIYDVENK